MAKEQAVYSHGHHSSVVNNHAQRTIKDSAAFLIPHIRPADRILDIGCGPGSISIGLAKLVPQGSVTAVDASESVIEQARALAKSENVENIQFVVEDANALPYADNSFDIVSCHQVLQHVKDPVSVLREMQRVAKPGGYVAAREADYSAFSWYPSHPGLTAWRQLYDKQARVNGGEPDAGKMTHVWARQAGFRVENIQNTVGAWCHTGPKAVNWAESWADRTLHSRFAETVKENGFASDEELQALSQAWKDWASKEDLWYCIPSGEMLYQVP